MIKDIIVYLPNKEGNYNPVKVPRYIQAILENVTHEYDYTYKLQGVNAVRPAYGIQSDLDKLNKWVIRYFADFTIKSIHKEPKNYYGLFEMTDPICYQLEKVGLLK